MKLNKAFINSTDSRVRDNKRIIKIAKIKEVNKLIKYIN